MKSLIKNTIMMVILIATLASCNQGPSLQTYFVDNEEKPNFLTVDIPLNILNIDEATLTEDQKEAYNSVRKVNMLAYKSSDTNAAEYKAELSKVKSILNDSKYEELMHGGNSRDGKFVIKILGGDDTIEEFILFGNANDKGFAVVRVLGNDMDPSKLMTLSSVLQKTDMSDFQMGEITDFFK